MIRHFLLLSFLLGPLAVGAEPLPLWPGKAPGALGDKPVDIPTLTPFLPPADKASGAAIVICPGGGYTELATDREGDNFARLFNERGMAAFVLKYRLGSSGYRHPVMLEDVSRAIRTVRANAAKWGVDSKRVGVIGFSAGGHLASTVMTHFDSGAPDSPDPVERQSNRPDLGILCYPVITMGAQTHPGSRKNLLGEHPSTELVDLLSNEKQVTAQTPPAFIWHTTEDGLVSVQNSLLFATALADHKVPFELHIYEKGGHGMGLGKSSMDPTRFHPWIDDLFYWLNERGYLKH